MHETRPYGTWPSPITAAALVSGAVGISDVVPDGNSVFWSESRPDEGGRSAIMRWHKDTVAEITPADANVRTTVHEYGGGSWWVQNGLLYYVDYSDQRLRALQTDGSIKLLSPETDLPKALRFADFRVTPDGAWLIAVCEKHRKGQREAENSLVAVATDGSLRLHTLQSGADFYSSPRLSADGRRLAWVEWQHPNMPWDDSCLKSAQLDCSGDQPVCDQASLVAGGENESVQQPSFSPQGELHFLSDRSDTWQLYRENSKQPVLQLDTEIGSPPWVFGLSTYTFMPDGSVVAARTQNGVQQLAGFEHFSSVNALRSSGTAPTFSASGWDSEACIVHQGKTIVRPRDLERSLGIGGDYLKAAELISFPTSDNDTAHALYFAPANPQYIAPEGEKPPLIVLAHGGPTSAARSQLSLARQFWTSRGFAVVDVNYRGSTGFGRAYRQKLNGTWGVTDVDDCVNAARFLAARGDVDDKRLLIRGGSAGGYTVLSALCFHDVFTAGCNMYGVADLTALAEDTHKFESRYLDNLVGPWPEAKDLYEERSPINHLEGFSAPMIVLQGSEDAIVPPNQSRAIVDALDLRKVPVAYIEFEGEQHGFRRAENIQRALNAELAFYGRIFGFTPAGEVEPVEIRNAENIAG